MEDEVVSSVEGQTEISDRLYRVLVGDQKETLPERDARSIVADAQQQAIALRFGWVAHDHRTPAFEGAESLTEIVDQATVNACNYQSVRCLDFVFKDPNKRQYFDRFFTLRTKLDSKVPFKDSEWPFHEVGLLRSKEGIWFIVLPSGNKVEGERRGVTDIIEEASLEVALSKLSERDGGDWPSGIILAETLETTYAEPKVNVAQQGANFTWRSDFIRYIYDAEPRGESILEKGFARVYDSYPVEKYLDEEIGDTEILRLDPNLSQPSEAKATVENWARFSSRRAAEFGAEKLKVVCPEGAEAILREHVRKGGDVVGLYSEVQERIDNNIDPLLEELPSLGKILVWYDRIARRDVVRQRARAVYTHAKADKLFQNFLKGG